MQCTASPAVIPIHIRNKMLAAGPNEYTWRGRRFEVVETWDRRLRVFELDCWEPRPEPMPQPAPAPAPAPQHGMNPWRIASFAAVGLGALLALNGFTTSYWHPFMSALPGLAIAGAGVAGVMHTQPKGSKLFG